MAPMNSGIGELGFVVSKSSGLDIRGSGIWTPTTSIIGTGIAVEASAVGTEEVTVVGVGDSGVGVVCAGAQPVRLALSTVETSRMINRVEDIFCMVSRRRDTVRSQHQRSDLWKNYVGGSPYS